MVRRVAACLLVLWPLSVQSNRLVESLATSKPGDNKENIKDPPGGAGGRKNKNDKKDKTDKKDKNDKKDKTDPTGGGDRAGNRVCKPDAWDGCKAYAAPDQGCRHMVGYGESRKPITDWCETSCHYVLGCTPETSPQIPAPTPGGPSWTPPPVSLTPTPTPMPTPPPPTPPPPTSPVPTPPPPTPPPPTPPATAPPATPPPTSSSSTSSLKQYTPDKAPWNIINAKIAEAYPNGQDPDQVHSKWHVWDGKPFNPVGVEKFDFFRQLCPEGFAFGLIGLRELFYEKKPFADNKNPTKAEVDNWNVEVMNHVRRLVGYTKESMMAQPDSCLFLQTFFSDERKYTNKWDATYPENTCGPDSRAHCGMTFMPNATDQTPYLLSGQEPCTPSARAEGIFYMRTPEPWSVKAARSICVVLKQEGFWGGHTGPWFRRQKFGWSFYHLEDESGIHGSHRFQGGGELFPICYCKPGDEEQFPGCDPEKTGPNFPPCSDYFAGRQ